MKDVDVTFLRNLAMTLGAGMISPKVLDKYGKETIVDPTGAGTGPYKYVSAQKDQNITSEAFDGYWGEKAKIKKLVVRIITDPGARVAALNNGEIDIATDMEEKLKSTIESNGNKLLTFDTQSTSYMSLATDREPFNNPEARKACIQAIDVDKLLALSKGEIKKATSFTPLSVAPSFAQGINYPKYNPDEAKKTFEKLGIKKIKMLTHTKSGGAFPMGAKVCAESIQAQLREVGVDMEIETLDFNAYLDAIPKRTADLYLMGWVLDNGDPSNILKLTSDHTDFLNNISAFNNKDYDAIGEEAAVTMDETKRLGLYKKQEEILAENCPIYPFWSNYAHAACKPNINNFSIALTHNIYFAKVTKS
jgi:peptide/nickel transport system substrate-binding protein